MRTPKIKRGRRATPPTVSARLSGHVTLEAHAGGKIIACFGGYSVDLGTFSAAAANRAQDLRIGVPLASFASGVRNIDKEIHLLVRRLARHGLLEYRLRSRKDDDQLVVEPQTADYWPGTPHLVDADLLVLSRFAYMRRRGNDMVLESPRAGAVFKICNPKIATAIALLSTPQQIKRLRRQDGFPGVELLAMLVDCQILFKIDADSGSGLRPAEGDENLVLWDFHDLLFHARSTEGRQANPLGGVGLYAGVVPPLPAVRPRWPGKKINLRKFSAAPSEAISPFAKLVRERHSTRSFDDQSPITLAELSRFLDGTARVLSRWTSRVDLGDGGPLVAYAVRPYPSAGASYELELYLAVDKCEGLARGFYHYDAGGHALLAIGARTHELEALLTGAKFAMDAPAAPQVLITTAARFGRISWKYSSLAYALILKDVGVLTQTFYLMATDMGLGGCAIGSTNIDLFAKMTGIEFHVEGPVGQFALGRGSKSGATN
ncbi:MAG TPA: SagB family peptide dehydrogenase [Pseudolabrys sp.]|nr:SagB family peptide dehydrogenase [Pseudolabrys sp.]